VAGARGARAAPHVASGCDAEIVHVTVPGRPARGTIASAKVWSTKCAQITSVSTVTRVCLLLTYLLRCMSVSMFVWFNPFVIRIKPINVESLFLTKFCSDFKFTIINNALFQYLTPKGCSRKKGVGGVERNLKMGVPPTQFYLFLPP